MTRLADVKAQAVDLHVNSPGGDYFAGVTIANAIRQHPAKVTVHVDGLAASAASVIAMAGDVVTMHPGSQLMIHDAMSLAVGNANDMRETAALLDKVSDDIAGMYADRAGGQRIEWRARMQAETWYSADEAVRAGLADESVVGVYKVDEPVAARWDLSIFKYQGREQAPEPEMKVSEAEVVSDEGDAPLEAPPAINTIDADQLRRLVREAVRK